MFRNEQALLRKWDFSYVEIDMSPMSGGRGNTRCNGICATFPFDPFGRGKK